MIEIKMKTEELLAQYTRRGGYSATPNTHAIELLIRDAKELGFLLVGLDMAKVYPERGTPYESPAILFINNQDGRHATISQRVGEFETFYSFTTYR